MSARLVFLSGSKKGEVALTRGDLSIGRDPKHDLAFSEEIVSRYQATVHFQNGAYLIRDDHSTNGTFVNNHRVGNHVLHDGDVIEFGLGGPSVRFAAGAPKELAGTGTVAELYGMARGIANAESGGKPVTATVMKEFVRLAYQRSRRRTRRIVTAMGVVTVLFAGAMLVKQQRDQESSRVATDRGLTPAEDSNPVVTTARDGRDVALLFATNEYEHWPDLINPTFDAQAIGKELGQHYGFEVHLIENATKIQVMDSVKHYAQQDYSDADQLLVFFAGHGAYDEEYLKDGYLAARDSDPSDADRSRTSAVQYNWLHRTLAGTSAKHVLLIIDACYGATFDAKIAQATSRGDDGYAGIDPAAFVSRKMSLTTRQYITSGGKERVPDGRPGEHTPFVRRLLEALRTYGGEKGFLTLTDLHGHLQMVDPEPRAGEFGDNEPGSSFLFILADPKPSS